MCFQFIGRTQVEAEAQRQRLLQPQLPKPKPSGPPPAPPAIWQDKPTAPPTPARLEGMQPVAGTRVQPPQQDKPTAPLTKALPARPAPPAPLPVLQVPPAPPAPPQRDEPTAPPTKAPPTKAIPPNLRDFRQPDTSVQPPPPAGLDIPRHFQPAAGFITHVNAAAARLAGNHKVLMESFGAELSLNHWKSLENLKVFFEDHELMAGKELVVREWDR